MVRDGVGDGGGGGGDGVVVAEEEVVGELFVYRMDRSPNLSCGGG